MILIVRLACMSMKDLTTRKKRASPTLWRTSSTSVGGSALRRTIMLTRTIGRRWPRMANRGLLRKRGNSRDGGLLLEAGMTISFLMVLNWTNSRLKKNYGWSITGSSRNAMKARLRRLNSIRWLFQRLLMMKIKNWKKNYWMRDGPLGTKRTSLTLWGWLRNMAAMA